MLRSIALSLFVLSCVANNYLRADRKVVNDLVAVISTPDFPYPFAEQEAIHRGKMEILKNYFPQVTRGSIIYNFDLDHDGLDDLFQVTMPAGTDPCDQVDRVATEARKRVNEQKPSIEFNHTTLLINQNSCTNKGYWLAKASGPFLISSKASLGILPHEYGHNMGFPHTGGDADNDNIRDSGGGQDPMEGSGTTFYNAPHIWGKGWFGNCTECFQDWDTNKNNVVIAPLATPSLASQPIVIARIADEKQTDKYYFFSYRAPLPGTFDQDISLKSITGLSIHHSEGKFRQTFLIHVMNDGEKYTIPNTLITVTQVAHDMNGVRISVDLGTKCAKNQYRKPRKFAWGNGTVANPYVICTSDQFVNFSKKPSVWGKYVQMGAGVDLSKMDVAPIGSESIPYSGQFWGSGKAIVNKHNHALFGFTQNALIKDIKLTHAVLDQGLDSPFGFIAEKAQGTRFENIFLEEISMSLSNNQGALVGIMEDGTIEHVKVTGIMQFSQDIENVGGLLSSGKDVQIQDSSVQIDLRTLSLSVPGISRFGSLAGVLKKSKISDSYALSNFFLSPSRKKIFAVGSLVGEATNIELNRVYYSGEVKALDSQNPATLVGDIQDDPNDVPNTIVDAKNAFMAINGMRETLVGEKISVTDIKSAQYLQDKGFDSQKWLLNDGDLPKLWYEYDAYQLPPEIDD